MNEGDYGILPPQEQIYLLSSCWGHSIGKKAIWVPSLSPSAPEMLQVLQLSRHRWSELAGLGQTCWGGVPRSGILSLTILESGSYPPDAVLCACTCGLLESSLCSDHEAGLFIFFQHKWRDRPKIHPEKEWQEWGQFWRERLEPPTWVNRAVKSLTRRTSQEEHNAGAVTPNQQTLSDNEE